MPAEATSVSPSSSHSLPRFLHGYTCQTFHKYCLNYISKVAVVRGVKRKRRHKGKASGKKKKKRAGARNKKREMGFGQLSEMQES